VTSIVSKLKEIVSLKEDVERRLKTLAEIELTLKYIYEKYVCNDDTLSCDPVTRELERWIKLYSYVKSEKDLNELINALSYHGFKVKVDFSKLELAEICDEHYHCIDVHEKLPLSEVSKEKLLQLIKRRIEQVVDGVDIQYSRLLLSLSTLISELYRDVKSLREQYEQLSKRLDKLISL
jgi:hypothetical protein